MMQSIKINKLKGFTLIELMVVVAIVALLAAIAIPSYQSQAQKTCRADAKKSLLDYANRQEKFYLVNNRYALPAEYRDGLGYPSNNAFDSIDGHYRIIRAGGYCPNTENSCYAERADVVAAGAQSGDDDCWRFLITSDGRKASTERTPFKWRFGDNDPCWQ